MQVSNPASRVPVCSLSASANLLLVWKGAHWTGDVFRLMDTGERPLVTRWARVALYLADGIDLIHQRRFDASASDILPAPPRLEEARWRESGDWRLVWVPAIAETNLGDCWSGTCM
jgi:hypothetical protein